MAPLKISKIIFPEMAKNQTGPVPQPHLISELRRKMFFNLDQPS